MPTDTITINRERLTEARLADPNYKNQTKLAKAAGISRSYLNEIESGKKQPSRPVIASLANVLELDPNDLSTDAVYRHGVWKT